MKKGIVLCFLLSLYFLCSTSQSCFLVGDLSGDCRVNLDDLVLMASQWMGPSCGTEAGLVVHWKLDESTGSIAADSSGSGYNGFVAGAGWNPIGGRLGGALQFDGINDYMWNSYPGIIGSNPRTCAAWIKTDQCPGEIMSWGDRDIEAARWVVGLNPSGVLCVDIGEGFVCGTTVLTDDLWHHIAVTSDGSATDHIVLYVDGRIETVAGVVSRSIDTKARATTKLGVFQLLYMEGSYFEGLIDDARIYNRVLDLKEVWNLATTASIIHDCADLNTDQTVNLVDAAHLSRNWGDQTPQLLINEFLASNASRSPLGPGHILDGNGEASDWIELYNNSQITVDIGGCYLTDDDADPTQWQLPAGAGELILHPGDYLIVFASGKTEAENPDNYPYVDPAGHLHTNFKLSKDGEYLGLFAADGSTLIHEYNHISLGGGEVGYPSQETDISYGYYYGEPRYLAPPTPGADNVAGTLAGFIEKPDVNVKGGCYESPLEVTMSAASDVFIRYTTDGTVPSLVNGLDYTGPIHIDSLTTLIAKSFKPGFHPSDVVMETYIFIDPAVVPFNSNLPIVVIDTLGVTIPNDPVNKTPAHCRAVIIDTDDVTGRANMTGSEHFTGWGQIRRRGESTYGQGHYAFEIQDEYGLDKEVSLLGMPAESDWILSVDVIDYTMLKNEMAFKWFRDMGHYAPRQRFVEVYLNTGGGVITPADYNGLYVIREKIKRNDDRVDIARLDASHNLEPKISGGYIIKNDKEDTGDISLNLETSPYGIIIDGNTSIVEPKNPTTAQFDWIENYMNQFHAALWQNTSSTFYVPDADYADFVDMTSWIDHGLVEQIGNDADAFRFSYFIHKDRGGKLFSGPPWDFDRSFHNSGSDMRSYTGWRVEHKIPGKWHLGLQQYPEYRQMLADRWFEHRENGLNTDQTMAYIDQQADLISEAMERSRSVWYFPRPFADEIRLFKDWITNRLDWLDGEIGVRFAEKPPMFSHPDGYVDQGDTLDISLPAGAAGTIYYTLNGEDPRLEGGVVNPNARIFNSGQFTEAVVAMSASSWKYRYGDTDLSTGWRALGFNDTSWNSGPGQLGFGDGDEAADIGPKVNGRRTTYFRHVFNIANVSEITDLSIDLLYDDGAVVYLNGQEVKRIDMPDGTITYSTLANGTSSDNKTAAFPVAVNMLNEGSNVLAVEVHQVSDTSTDLSFDLGLNITRFVTGSSQIILNKSTCVRARILNDTQWSAQNKAVFAVGPVAENLRVSELMYHPADPNTEFIELQNVGTQTINLNLVQFSKGVEFLFDDTALDAGQYALIIQDPVAFTNKYGPSLNVVGYYTGRLDNAGETIEIKDALGTTIQSFDYEDNWYELTDGLGFSLTMVNPYNTAPNNWQHKDGWRSSLSEGGTPGTTDSVLAADSIVINELLAHSHGTAPDWIELYNTTDQDINIGGWFLSDDDSDSNAIRKYEIPGNTMIEAHDYLVLIENTSFGDPLLPAGQGFGLSEAGETLYLYSGQNGQLTGYYQSQQQFDASDTDMTFGRYEKPELSDGYDFARMENPTEGLPNSAPLIPSIVITEIHYNPSTGADDEYVELCNRSGSTVTLMTQATTETAPGVFTTESIPWRLEGTGFEFPANVTMAPGEYILVAKVPLRYSFAPCDVYGPYDGKLDNGGEELAIQIPGDQEFGKERYWIPIEKIKYDDTALWPTSPDGSGDSLQRIDINVYGRDYSNWNAAAPTPGV